MTDDDGYLQVRNWHEFQHSDSLRSNTFPWIRLHRRIIHDYDFHRLDEADQLLLLKLWCMADKEGRLPADPAGLAWQLRKPKPLELGPLIEAGFLIPTGLPQFPGTSAAVSPERVEREERESRVEGEAREALEDFNTVRGKLQLRALSGAEHRRAISAALKRGHTVDELRQAAAAAAMDEWVLSTSNLSPVHVFRARNMTKYLDAANGNGRNPADVKLANRLEQFRQEREARGET